MKEPRRYVVLDREGYEGVKVRKAYTGTAVDAYFFLVFGLFFALLAYPAPGDLSSTLDSVLAGTMAGGLNGIALSLASPAVLGYPAALVVNYMTPYAAAICQWGAVAGLFFLLVALWCSFLCFFSYKGSVTAAGALAMPFAAVALLTGIVRLVPYFF